MFVYCTQELVCCHCVYICLWFHRPEICQPWFLNVTAGHNPYNLLIFTIVYSKNLPTSYLRTIEHMTIFVVKSIHIQINSQVMDLSISCIDPLLAVIHNYYNLFVLTIVYSKIFTTRYLLTIGHMAMFVV